MSLIVDDGICVYGVPAVLQLAYQSTDRQVTEFHHDFRLAAADVRHLAAHIGDFIIIVIIYLLKTQLKLKMVM